MVCLLERRQRGPVRLPTSRARWSSDGRTLIDRHRTKTQTAAQSAAFAFIEGFYNSRCRHSPIGYRLPIDYERRRQLAAVGRDAHRPAFVRGRQGHALRSALKKEPPLTTTVRDERTGVRVGKEAWHPPGAEPKNGSKPQNDMPSNQPA
jgi:hypothetical protein